MLKGQNYWNLDLRREKIFMIEILKMKIENLVLFHPLLNMIEFEVPVHKISRL